MRIMTRNTKEEARRLVPRSENGERSDWTRLLLESLARAYGEDEPEYPLDLIKEPSPEFEGG